MDRECAMENYVDYNRTAWNREVQKGNRWTTPVSEEAIESARNGVWDILVSPSKPVPQQWFPPLSNRDVLCLASGGGQQGPILAAAGANVVVFDNSPGQLQQDEFVAKRDSLDLQTELGDMQDLSRFSDGSFDLIIANGIGCVEDISKVWRETYRVLRYGGILISGGSNPVEYVFDLKEWDHGHLVPRFEIPYSDARDLTPGELHELVVSKGEPMFFGHSLEKQIQGQIEVGFAITGFYDDMTKGSDPLAGFVALYFGIKATKVSFE
jgi:SAM-dependent methyltransferase